VCHLQSPPLGGTPPDTTTRVLRARLAALLDINPRLMGEQHICCMLHNTSRPMCVDRPVTTAAAPLVASEIQTGYPHKRSHMGMPRQVLPQPNNGSTTPATIPVLRIHPIKLTQC